MNLNTRTLLCCLKIAGINVPKCIKFHILRIEVPIRYAFDEEVADDDSETMLSGCGFADNLKMFLRNAHKHPEVAISVAAARGWLCHIPKVIAKTSPMQTFVTCIVNSCTEGFVTDFYEDNSDKISIRLTIHALLKFCVGKYDINDLELVANKQKYAVILADFSKFDDDYVMIRDAAKLGWEKFLKKIKNEDNKMCMINELTKNDKLGAIINIGFELQYCLLAAVHNSNFRVLRWLTTKNVDWNIGLPAANNPKVIAFLAGQGANYWIPSLIHSINTEKKIAAQIYFNLID